MVGSAASDAQGVTPLRPLAEDLWCMEAPLPPTPLSRRMTVVRLPEGGLAVISAIRMDEPGMAALDAVGPVRFIVVPNGFHGLDAPWYAERYPEAAVLVPAGVVPKVRRRTRVDGTLEDDWGLELDAALAPLRLEGVRTHEWLFLHRASRTLIVTDLVFNLGREARGLGALLLRLTGAYGRFGPTRLFRWALLRDKAALRASLGVLAGWDYDRLVPAHGAIVETGAAARMRKAFAWLERG